MKRRTVIIHGGGSEIASSIIESWWLPGLIFKVVLIYFGSRMIVWACRQKTGKCNNPQEDEG